MCSAAARPTTGPGIVPFLVTYRNSATLEPLRRAPGPVEHEAGYELVLVLPLQTVTRIMAARPHSGGFRVRSGSGTISPAQGLYVFDVDFGSESESDPRR
jgi:hypothetical protein